MPLNESFLAELQMEAAATRKMIERVPEKSFDWKPHDKSMTLGRLAYHISENPQWVSVTVDKDEIDFTWSGIMGFNELKKPEIKKISDRITFAMSCNGMGIALSSFIAKEIVNEINL